MRFPIAALFLVIVSFIFFVAWAVTSFLLDEVYDAMIPFASGVNATYASQLGLLPTAFGIICAIFFVAAIIVTFVMESLSDEPEYYWR